MIATWIQTTVGGLPRTFWFLWLGTLINRVGIFVLPFLTVYLTAQRGLSVEQATGAVSVYGIGSFTSQVVGGWLSDRWGRRPTMLLSLFVTPVILLVLMSATDYGWIVLSTLLIGLSRALWRRWRCCGSCSQCTGGCVRTARSPQPRSATRRSIASAAQRTPPAARNVAPISAAAL